MTDVADTPAPGPEAPVVRPGADAAGEHAGLRGVLDQGALSPILDAAAQHRFTGMLAIGLSGEVWMDQGRVYLASGPASPTPFEVLLGAGVGTRAELDDRCATADNGGEPVLDQLAVAVPEAMRRLRRLLHEHNLAALFELMVPSGDVIELRPGARHAIGARFAEPADELAAVAAGRLDLWRRIAERIPSTGTCFRMARVAPGEEDRRVTADEWTFLALLDGRRSVADVITGTGESAFRVCSLLYRMLLEGLIEPVPATAGP